MALTIIHDVVTGNTGSLCVTENYRTIFIRIDTTRYEGTRQKADMAALLLQDLGVSHHNGMLQHFFCVITILLIKNPEFCIFFCRFIGCYQQKPNFVR